ncbi:MAG: histidine triad nucleotide-binding protein [Acidobacteriota bacterium]|nr:histidine triad nucleotide-binding protein [Acidobacteriota bacterium]
MSECIFCRIVHREIPAKIIFEDESTVAFEDIRPEAPQHFLVVPKEHLESLAKISDDHEPLLGHLLSVAAKLARERGLEPNGYRTVVNTGAGAGQTVFHLHVHVLGGRTFHWPPG